MIHPFKKILLWFLLSLPLVAGCAPRYLDKTPDMALHYSNVPVDAQELNNFKALVAINPKDPQAVKARFWIAQDVFNRSGWVEAEKEFLSLAKHHPKSDWATAALVMVARAQDEQKKRLAALATLRRVMQGPAGRQPEIIQVGEDLAQKIINDEMNLAELAQVRSLYAGTAWDPLAAFVSAKRQLDQGNAEAATKAFQDFIAAYPQHGSVALARELMDKAARLVPLNRNRIGCLLPLSGTYATYGTAIRQGLELALKEINEHRPEGEHLGLVVADTQGNSGGALSGLKRLADVEKVMAVIGPVLSSDVKAVLPEINQGHIAIITPSAGEPGLTGSSPYFFRYMLTNQQQGEAMAEYVVLRKNFLKVGILNGQDPYDRSLADAFEAKIKQLGGEIVARVEYPAGQTDFKEQMLALGGVDPGKMKDLEIQERKALERLLETASFGLSQWIAPNVAPVTDPKAPAPAEKKVALVRLAEEGEQSQKEDLGKAITEKLSYALAVRPGLDVLTQEQTFKGLKKLGLSTLAMDEAGSKNLGNELDADYVILGKVKQKEPDTAVLPAAGAPIPIHYQISLVLIRVRTGEEIKRYVYEWTKSVSAESNVKEMEAIYMPVPAGDAVLIASQLDFYDFKVAFFGSDSWVTPKLLRQGAEALEGATVATGFWMDDPSSQTADFVKAFEGLFSVPPSLLSVQAYDTLWLAAGVMKNLSRGTAQREDFQRGLMGVKDFNGVTGKAVVSPDGEVRREPVFLEISKGKFQRVR